MKTKSLFNQLSSAPMLVLRDQYASPPYLYDPPSTLNQKRRLRHFLFLFPVKFKHVWISPAILVSRCLSYLGTLGSDLTTGDQALQSLSRRRGYQRFHLQNWRGICDRRIRALPGATPAHPQCRSERETTTGQCTPRHRRFKH